tara:strand:- start:4 stop:213 length:210 start_codon:yes stop_codon:yes gene_type:complete
MNTETKQKECQGYCPNCNSENLTYGRVQIDGNDLHYPYTCDDCNTKGKEHYYITYDITEGLYSKQYVSK